MTGAAPQVWSLLRVAVTLDARAGGPGRGRLSRAQLAFGLTLGLYFAFGCLLASSEIAGLPLFPRIVVDFTIAGAFVAFGVITEFHGILLAPTDADVLYWRPIGARTLFVARLLHLGVNVCTLTAVLLAVPAVDVVASVPGPRVLVGFCFAIAAVLHAFMVSSLVAVVSMVLLRVVARDRFQDGLVWAQIAVAIVVLVVAHGLGPVLERSSLQGPTVPRWLHLVPAAWFAHLPAAASGLVPGAHVGVFGAGLAAFAAFALRAARALAPAYAMNLMEAQAADAGRILRVAVAASPWQRSWWLPRALGTASLGRDPLRLAGFDFLLAHLHGERRLRLTLLPLFAMPLVDAVLGLLASDGWDPYASERGTTAFDARRVAALLFGATYSFVLLGVITLRNLASSPSWRAAWVFFVAPVQRFERFQSGILCAVFTALLLPAAVLVLVLLLVAWRDPVHVMAHLALPLALAALGVVLVHLLEPAVPFAREPLRHERSVDWVVGFLVLLPVGALAHVHYGLRSHPNVLLMAGLVAAAIAATCLRLARGRLQELPPREFED